MIVRETIIDSQLEKPLENSSSEKGKYIVRNQSISNQALLL